MCLFLGQIKNILLLQLLLMTNRYIRRKYFSKRSWSRSPQKRLSSFDDAATKYKKMNPNSLEKIQKKK